MTANPAPEDDWFRLRPTDLLVVLPFAAIPAAIALDAFVGVRPAGVRPFLHPVLLALMVVAGAAWVRRGCELPRATRSLLVLVASFVPAMVLASADPYATEKVQQLLILLPGMTFGAILVLDRPHRIYALLWVFGGLGVLVAGLTVMAPDPVAELRGSLALRNTEYITTARIIGHGVVALLALAILSRRSRTRLVAIAGAAAATPALILTGSRGPVAAAAIAMVVLLALQARGLGRMGAVGAAGLALAAGAPALLAYLPTHLHMRFGVLVGGPMDTSAENRITLARVATDVITSRPLGLGWGNFSQVVPARLASVIPASADGKHRVYPHNLLLEVGAEGGWLALVGLAVFAVAVVRALAAGSNHRSVQAISAMLVFALVNALVSSDITGNVLVWILAGAALARPAAFARPLGPASISPGAGAITR